MYCTKQVYTLLASFIDSEDMFLSNDTIVGICGWHKNDFGLNEKRRTAISNLRKSLKMNDFGILIKYVRIISGYDADPNLTLVDFTLNEEQRSIVNLVNEEAKKDAKPYFFKRKT